MASLTCSATSSGKAATSALVSGYNNRTCLLSHTEVTKFKDSPSKHTSVSHFPGVHVCCDPQAEHAPKAILMSGCRCRRSSSSNSALPQQQQQQQQWQSHPARPSQFGKWRRSWQQQLLKQQQQQRHKATTIHKHSMAPGNGVSCASAKSTAVQVVAGFSALGSPRSRQRDRSHAAAQQQCSEPCKATSLVKSGVIKVFLRCVRAFLLCVCVLCARQLVAPDSFDQLRLSCCCVAVRPLAAWRRSAVC